MNARFGYAVRLDGDQALIGAPSAKESGRSFHGAAYLFERKEDGQWAQTARLIPPDTLEGSRFGDEVALPPGGLVVGAPRASTVSSEAAGAVFIYGQ